MTKTVKVRAYKKLGPTGKVENVDAHMRELTPKIAKLNKSIVRGMQGFDLNSPEGRKEYLRRLNTRKPRFKKVSV